MGLFAVVAGNLSGSAAERLGQRNRLIEICHMEK